MRFKLYEANIERTDSRSRCYVVAPSDQRAAELIVEHDMELRQKHLQFTLERVDKVLPDVLREGLDDMLETAPVCLASYSEEIGWVGHVAVLQQLRLFRIEDSEGSETFVIAPSTVMASGLYLSANALVEGEQRPFRIFDGLASIPAGRIANLHAMLEFGPVGIVAYYKEHGWLAE